MTTGPRSVALISRCRSSGLIVRRSCRRPSLALNPRVHAGGSPLAGGWHSTSSRTRPCRQGNGCRSGRTSRPSGASPGPSGPARCPGRIAGPPSIWTATLRSEAARTEAYLFGGSMSASFALRTRATLRRAQRERLSDVLGSRALGIERVRLCGRVLRQRPVFVRLVGFVTVQCLERDVLAARLAWDDRSAYLSGL